MSGRNDSVYSRLTVYSIFEIEYTDFYFLKLPFFMSKQTATENRERSKGTITNEGSSGTVGVDEGLVVGLVVGF